MVQIIDSTHEKNHVQNVCAPILCTRKFFGVVGCVAPRLVMDTARGSGYHPCSSRREAVLGTKLETFGFSQVKLARAGDERFFCWGRHGIFDG